MSSWNKFDRRGVSSNESKFNFLWNFIVTIIVLIIIGKIILFGVCGAVLVKTGQSIQKDGLKSIVDKIWNGQNNHNQ